MLCSAAFVLQRELAHLSWNEIARGIGQMPPGELVAAIALAVLSFVIGGWYEAAALRAVGYPLGALRPLVVYTVANSIGHCLGWSVVTGGALRWRLYERDGLTARAIAGVAALSAIPFFLGAWLLLALASLDAAAQIGPQLRLNPEFVRGAAIAALVALGLLLAALSRRGSVRIGRLRISSPGGKLLTIQLVAGVVELVIVASMLYVLLYEHGQMSYTQFLVSYVAAVLLGQISSVPAGIGVLEASLLVFLPQVPTAALIAAVAGYRAIYEGLPLLVGLLMLFAEEIRWRYRAPGTCSDERGAVKPAVPRP
jgi:uncharacterized membrane protein YbhN (UPF0104 family)